MRTLYISILCCCLLNSLQAQLSVGFTASDTQACVPSVINFADNSTTSGTITQWTWKRDGSIFSQSPLPNPNPNPSLLFNTPGVFDICLIVEDDLGNIDSSCQTITIFQGPSANYIGNNLSGCAPVNSSFTDLSTIGDVGIAQWRWDFGDGSIDTVTQNPNHSYTVIGTLDVTLEVIDSNGCSDFLLRSDYVQINETPTAAVAHNAYSAICDTTTTVIFNGLGTSSTGSLSYTWDFGDNSTSNIQNISHNYSNFGCYTPTLTVSNGFCTATATTTSCITVAEPSSASFNISDPTGCQLPHSVSFTSTTSNIASYSWDFGEKDGIGSTQANPTYTYTTYEPEDSINYPNGVFPVQLAIEDINGCVDTLLDTILINNLSADTDVGGLGGCQPVGDTISEGSIHISSFFNSVAWEWDLDILGSASTPSVIVNYPDTGDYSISLIVTDNIGCKDTTYVPVSVGMPPIIDSIVWLADTICKPDLIHFEAYGSSYIDFWEWAFSDGGTNSGSTIDQIFIDSGYITGTLITGFNGCFSAQSLGDSLYVNVPIARFKPVYDCSDFTVQFIDTSLVPHNWFWDFGVDSLTTDTSTLQHPTYTYPDTGTYIVRLIVCNDSTNCCDTTRIALNLGPVIADFEFQDSVCAPMLVPLVLKSVNASQDAFSTIAPASIQGNLSNFTIYCPQGGVFPITLYSQNERGCRDTITKDIHVAAIDTSWDINSLVGCPPLNVTITDSSTGILSPIVSWQWHNGSTTQSIAETYTTGGSKPIELIVQNSWNCTDTIRDTIEVSDLAVFFNANRNVCINSTFTAVAYPSGSYTPFSYTWDFGDGTIVTTPNSIHYHQYDSAGTYDICLTVEDSLGCVKTMCRNNWTTVHDPSVNFTADTTFSSCPPLEVNFSNLSISGTQWDWNFGDNSVSNIEHPIHVYSEPGFYDVTLTVTAFPGCSDTYTFSQMIQITGPTGDFNFNVQSGCSPLDVQFVGQGSNLVSYQWFWGNGNSVIHNTTANNDTANFSYTQPGQYVPILVVNDGLGCQIPIEKDTITVYGFPVASISADSLACQFDSIQFNTNPDSLLGTNIEWYFEGGSPNYSTLPNPLVYYADTGSFDVTLILEKDGCIDTSFYPNYVQIKAAPLAHFGADSAGCAPFTNLFADSSSTADGFIQSWNWAFGNGLTDTIQNPSTTFQTVDSFDVKLVVSNNFGCMDSTSQRIHAYPSPIADAGSYSAVCNGDSLQLNATGGGTYHWIAAPNLSNDTIANPIAIATTNTQYLVEVTNSFGCTDYDTTAITVHSIPILSLVDTATICQGDSSQLTITGSFLDYTWTDSTSLTCGSCPSPIASPTSNTTYYLEVQDSNNCKALDSILVEVNPLPIPSVITDTALCTGDSLMLWASGGQTYQWSPNIGISDSSLSNPIVYPTDTTLYTVMISDSNNCRNSASVLVATQSKPQITINNTPNNTCLGDTVQLTAQGADQYVWSPGNLLSDSTIANPSLILTSNSNLVLIGQTTAGCSDTAQIALSPLPLPIVDAGNLDSICMGDSITLTPSSNLVNYQWSISTSLSCLNCQNPVASPNNNTTYYLEGSDNNGCSNIDSVQILVLQQANLQLSATDSSLCAGDSTQLSISSSHNFQWLQAPFLQDPIATTSTIYPIDSTWYIAQTTNTCAAIDSIFITVVPTNHSALNDQTICQGDSATLNLGNANTINWQGDSLSCYNCPVTIAYPNNTHQYSVSFLTQEGCPIQDTVDITVLSQATLALSATDSSLCAGDSTQLSINSSHNFQWVQAPYLQDSLATTSTIYPVDSTWYIAQTTNTCATIDSIFIMVVPTNHSALNDQTICQGDSATLNLGNASNIVWQGDSLSCYSCPVAIAQPSSTQQYTVSFLTLEGCPIQDTVNINITEIPNLQLTDSSTICLGDSIVLAAQSNQFTTVEWSPSLYLSDSSVLNPTAEPSQSQKYIIEIANLGCTEKDSIQLLVIEGTTINAADVEICIGDSAQLLATGNATNYQWLPTTGLNKPDIPDPIAVLSQSQTYQVIGERNNCGSDTAYVDVLVNSAPNLQTVSPVKALKGSSVELEITTDINNTILWSPADELSCSDCPNPTWVANQDQVFQILVRDDKGCVANDSILLTTFLECVPDLVGIPNAFTPNNDGLNDILYARSSSVQTIETFQIYNRWGELVFETTDMQKGWDGRYKGKELAPNVYGYMLAFKCPATGEQLFKKGNVTLIR
ncbi:MAG: PKD domain-containing protein [Aureispira sp.]|nr:PKD domain-containing protein [Aureispira sp.]